MSGDQNKWTPFDVNKLTLVQAEDIVNSIDLAISINKHHFPTNNAASEDDLDTQIYLSFLGYCILELKSVNEAINRLDVETELTSTKQGP
jgi:hypothetical protein